MNPETTLTLDECVGEVLGLLTGLDLTYDPQFDRYRAIARQLNRALRANALEREWSWYSSTQILGVAQAGMTQVWLPQSLRARVVNDDAVRFVETDGTVVAWAYFLPRDALHKYQGRVGIWAAVTRNEISFSRDLAGFAGCDIQVPVMREPTLFRLPVIPEDPSDPREAVPAEVREQPLDFPYPDVITLRAAFYYAQTDPVMQPRVQTLEAQYKDLMYQVIERDERNTDSPYENDFIVPVQAGLSPDFAGHTHPHSADLRR